MTELHIELPPELVEAIAARAAELVLEQLLTITPPKPDAWMTVAEASSYLHLTPTALRARVRRGTVPAHRDGTRYLFHRGELDAHLLHADAATMLGSSSADGPARLHPPGPWLQGGNLEAE